MTPVLRGTVHNPVLRSVAPAVEDAFGFAEMQIVSLADLYAGKIVAALDRQHPRDLFDVRDLLANEGIDDALRQAFVVYLISHNRPMAETLAPARKPLAEEFKRGLVGMTQEPIELAALEETREAIVAQMVDGMPEKHREFLIGFKAGDPDWQLLDIPHAKDLPAVLWKQRNLDALPTAKRLNLGRSFWRTRCGK